MSNLIVLPFTFGPSGGVSGGPDKPRILYDNLLQSDDVTLSTDAPVVADYEYQNAIDMRGYTFWRVGAGTYYLQAVFPSAQTINSWAMYSQTLFEEGATIQLKYSTNGGASWNNAGAAVAPVDNAPIYKVLSAPISAARWRFEIVTPATVDIGILSFGQDFTFERGCWVGFAPPLLARDTDITNTVSQNGVWLGRTIIREGVMFDFSLDKLTPGWVRTYWHPFVKHAELEPWFLLWNKTTYPSEAAYCWAEGRIATQEYSHVNFMRAGMRVKGKVE